MQGEYNIGHDTKQDDVEKCNRKSWLDILRFAAAGKLHRSFALLRMTGLSNVILSNAKDLCNLPGAASAA
jgi:hypothetical protein